MKWANKAKRAVVKKGREKRARVGEKEEERGERAAPAPGEEDLDAASMISFVTYHTKNSHALPRKRKRYPFAS